MIASGLLNTWLGADVSGRCLVRGGGGCTRLRVENILDYVLTGRFKEL